ncbi:MAG: hypothetical protein WA989_02930 [Henriciella sp.]|uniref:hypothetical protein n=1 Tax=Henriciella sp. TaxID=1968823 RepID=UPI003C7279A9
MSEETLRAMLVVGMSFAGMVSLRALYVVIFYQSWSLDELLGFSDDGWETTHMKQNRRDFWR